ncbi:acyl-CoA dehydrogenase [Paenibacillus hodogayensis]|uniref:Acyl-CoA dehydrogenase n=1 Tax=Paenibacillus hodogayensis TaxID=279208 RepID=A0ABV5W3Y9_9BACL
MILNDTEHGKLLNQLIQRSLKPVVHKIDAEAYYPEEYLTGLGRTGLLPARPMPEADIRAVQLSLVEQTARTCMTTAFNLWCHLAAMTYVRASGNSFLQNDILPLLETGRMLGATGLSNPMKYYACLESLCLKARKSGDGYIVTGKLPSVSNLGPDHVFGIVAEADEHTRVMALVPCSSPGLSLKEKSNYLGLNGSATFMCEFNEVHVPERWILSEQADEFVFGVRSQFLLYQIPLGLGVTAAAVRSMKKLKNRQNGCSRFLRDQPEQLEEEWQLLREELYRFAARPEQELAWDEAVRIRLEVVYLTLRAVQSGMLHAGSAGYMQSSSASRRLREAYFMANLTPTVKHLEKMRQSR